MQGLDRLAPPVQDRVLGAVRECAADLATIRDRTVILRGIVRRTRALLGTHMSYLSLNDLTAGDTYIHITDGVETEAYRNIRMPLGTGVLGSVAAGGTAVQTADYLADPAMNHLGDIDEIVRNEGVKAILGAPIRVGGRVVGALLVAHRTATVFGETAIAALIDMAAQAAVAFEQTRLAAEIARLSREHAATESETQARQDELEAMLRLDDRLMGGLLSTAGLPGVVDVLAEAIGAPVSIYDPTGFVLAGSPILDGERLRAADVRAAVDASHHGRSAAALHIDGAPLLIVAVAAGPEHLATIMTVDAPARRSLVERASVYVSTLLLFERTLVDADNRAQSALVEDIVRLDGVPDQSMRSRLNEYGIRPETRSLVLVCAVPATQQHRALLALRDQFAQQAAVVSVHSGHLCVIAADDTRTPVVTLRERVLDRLAVRSIDALIGVARATDAAHLRQAHGDALAVSDALAALGHDTGIADEVELGLAGMLVGGSNAGRVGALVDRFLEPLLEYDRAHGSRLCETAWTYLEHGGRAAPVAAALHVHVNTVRQRAERIDAILGEGWRVPPASVDVHFALRLWRLRAAP